MNMVDRLTEHSCRLKRRGLRPAPVHYGHCEQGSPLEI